MKIFQLFPLTGGAPLRVQNSLFEQLALMLLEGDSHGR